MSHTNRVMSALNAQRAATGQPITYGEPWEGWESKPMPRKKKDVPFAPTFDEEAEEAHHRGVWEKKQEAARIAQAAHDAALAELRDRAERLRVAVHLVMSDDTGDLDFVRHQVKRTLQPGDLAAPDGEEAE